MDKQNQGRTNKPMSDANSSSINERRTDQATQQSTKDFYVRNIPEPVHRRFKAMAAFTGKGLSELAILSIDAYVSALEQRLPQFNNLSKEAGQAEEKEEGK